MIEMVVESVRVNLMSPSRVVVLKECDGPRYLAIMIGSGEADAIAVKLQGHETPRPLTHDLLKQVIETVGGSVTHVVVTDLVDTTYFATIVLDISGSRYKRDCVTRIRILARSKAQLSPRKNWKFSVSSSTSLISMTLMRPSP